MECLQEWQVESRCIAFGKILGKVKNFVLPREQTPRMLQKQLYHCACNGFLKHLLASHNR